LTIGYPIPYGDHHAKTLRDRPDRRGMDNPRTHPQTRPLRRENQNPRTPQILPPTRNRQRYLVSPQNRLPVATTPPRPPLIRVHRSGTKKVPLGVNFIHYDNIQTAQCGRRVPDRNTAPTPPTRAHTRTTRPHPLAPVRPHRTRHARPNPSVPVPCPTHPHRPQHLATTPQTPPTTPLPQSDPVPNLAAPRGGVVAPARSVPCLRRYHTGQPLDGAGPVAWKVVRGNTQGAWLPLCEALLSVLRGALPQAIPAYVFGGYGRPSGLRQSCATGGIR
jgi:hypothetical protein